MKQAYGISDYSKKIRHYSYPKNTLGNAVHSQEPSNSNVEVSCEISNKNLLLDLSPGPKSGLERFLNKYPNWNK